MTNLKNAPETDRNIDLLQLVAGLWAKRKFILRVVGATFLTGIFVAFFTSNQYSSSTTIAPQISNSESINSGLGGLASLAGINLNGMNGGTEIPPMLYPKIINSVPFQLKMLETQIKIEGVEHSMTYSEYYSDIHKEDIVSKIKGYTIGLPMKLIKLIKGKPDSSGIGQTELDNEHEKTVYEISYAEKDLIKSLMAQLNLEINNLDGFVNISFTMHDRYGSAQMTMRAQELLQQAIIDFKIKNAEDKLQFTQRVYEEKQLEFNNAQEKLGRFRDQNQNISTSLARSEQDRLVAEYDLAFNVFTEIAKQLEVDRIKVKESTPSFTILQPVVVPIEKSSPRRMTILVVSLFMGFLLSIGLIFISYKKTELLQALKGLNNEN